MDPIRLTYYLGMALGAALILSVCSVYLKKKSAGSGEVAFCAFGVVLVGLSIWSRVRIEAGDLKLELDRLSGQQKRIEAVVQETASTVITTSQALNVVSGLAARPAAEVPPVEWQRALAEPVAAADRLRQSAAALVKEEIPPE